MSWKCPECGNIENTDDQAHCSCGREVSDAELVVAKVEASRILEAGKDQSQDESEPDGFTYLVRTFQFLALVSGIFFNYYGSIKFRPVLTSLSIFIFMALVLTDSIHRKQISMKYHVVKKQDIPSMYNTFIVLFCIITLAIFVKLAFEVADLF